MPFFDLRVRWDESSGFGPKSDDLGHRILKSDFIPSDFTKSDCIRTAMIGDFFPLNLEIVFLVFIKKNVVIIFEHTLPCNVPSIRITTIHSKGYDLHRD